MVNEESVQAAIADLNSQETPNYSQTAEKYGIDRNTLARRHKGKTVSRHDAVSKTHKLLTDAQEEVLFDHIRELTDRGIPPTPKILQNLVVEIVKHPVGGRWVSRFRQRYKDRLKSVYLKGLDHSRHIADNKRHYKHYFDSV
jgi:Tc5 transposase-like DNA-binding protein